MAQGQVQVAGIVTGAVTAGNFFKEEYKKALQIQ